jgi:hypothetical protein
MCRYLATSISGFVQQLAVSYLPHGYWFYVTGAGGINLVVPSRSALRA